MPVRHRLFYALRPPQWHAQQIGLLRDTLGEAESIVRDDRLHVTLAVTPEYERLPRGLADDMIAIGAAVLADPVEVLLDQLSGSHRSIALRPARANPGLRALNNRLEAPLRRLGAAFGREFSPHVTLLYRKGRSFTRPVTPIAWQADAFVLIHSEIGRTRHHELGRWPLMPVQGSLF